MLCGLSDLFKAEGLTKSCVCPIEESRVQFFGTSYEILEKSPVSLVLTHLKDRKVKVKASVSLVLCASCDRCLKEVRIPIDLEFERDVFLQSPSTEQREEQQFMTGNDLDVDQLVNDELIQNLPMSVYCRPDCAGLCPTCGKDLNEGPCDCRAEEEASDTRMSMIMKLYQQNKEV